MVTSTTAETITCLENELKRLRQSTSRVLKQTWEEVDEKVLLMQREIEDCIEQTQNMEEAIHVSKRNEEEWCKRCLRAEKQLIQNGNGDTSKLLDDAMLSSNDKKKKIRRICSRSSLMTSFSPSNSLRTLWSSVSSKRVHTLQQEQEEKQEGNPPLKQILQELNLRIITLQKSIKARDETVTLLSDQLLDLKMQEAKAKLEMSMNRNRNEDVMEKKLFSEYQKMQSMDKRIAKISSSLIRYREYIDELVSELEGIAEMMEGFEKEKSETLPLEVLVE